MKKSLLIILLAGVWLPLFARETVIFIPGWFTEWINYSRHRKLLDELFPGAELQICRWDSNRLWKNAKISAADAVGTLTEMVISHNKTENITLIGHSLGGRIILDSAAILSGKNIKVKQIVLLGSAAGIDSRKLTLLQKLSLEPVINICCPKDNILKLYCQEENELPLGFAGLPQPIENFRQYRMNIPEKSLKIGKLTILSAETLEPARHTAAHLAIYYLKTLHQAFSGEIPEYYLDYAALKKIAGRNSCRIKNISNFRSIENFEDWKLAGHTGKHLYRIISPAGENFYYTDKQTAMQNFREIKRRISAALPQN